MAKIGSSHLEAVQKFLNSKSMQKAAGVILRRTKRGIIIAARPVRTKAASLSQKEQNEKFKAAIAYAQAVKSNPKQQASYLRKLAPGESVYRRAVTDYLNDQSISEGTRRNNRKISKRE